MYEKHKLQLTIRDETKFDSRKVKFVPIIRIVWLLSRLADIPEVDAEDDQQKLQRKVVEVYSENTNVESSIKMESMLCHNRVLKELHYASDVSNWKKLSCISS